MFEVRIEALAIPFVRAAGCDAHSVAGGMWAWLASAPSQVAAGHDPRGLR